MGTSAGFGWGGGLRVNMGSECGTRHSAPGLSAEHGREKGRGPAFCGAHTLRNKPYIYYLK